MTGPSRHLSWSELACWNRLGRPFKTKQPGEMIAAYPQAFREHAAILLSTTFEDIRQYLGNHPIRVTSAYRSLEYNAAVGGARSSQHCKGAALDIAHTAMTAAELHEAILKLQRAGRLPFLGGLGKYATFVHVDVREKIRGRLSSW